MNHRKVTLSVLAGLGFFFILSLSLTVFLPGRLSRVVLNFPKEIGSGLAPEVRNVPMTWDKEKNAENLVKEVLLGPARPDRLRLFSRDAALRSTFTRDQTLYVDLSLSTLLPDAEAPLPFASALQVLQKDILFNVQGYRKVEFAFQGQPVLDKFR